jgi:L-amino acid N-acyltransferase YncA
LITIDQTSLADWPAIRRIFEEGIATGNATFASSAPAAYDEWMEGTVENCVLVARNGSDVVGWATARRVSRRPAYTGVVLLNIYVAERHRGEGIGSLLLSSVISRAEREGIWTIEAWIFPENTASISLHRKYGFRVVGTREKIGRMDYGMHAGRWRDVLLLERRSGAAGGS